MAIGIGFWGVIFIYLFEVTEGQATVINIPLEQAYAQDSSGCVLETALRIMASDSVSVFVADYRRGSFDVSCALPVSSLGSDYLVQTFHATGDQEGERAVLSVVALADNTIVDFLLSCDTKYGHFAKNYSRYPWIDEAVAKEGRLALSPTERHCRNENLCSGHACR